MATIGTIRKNSGIVLALIGLAMLGFILTDLFTSGRMIAGGGGPKGVGTIYGEEINQQDFDYRFKRGLQNQMQNSGPDANLTPTMEGQVNDQIWNDYVNTRIMDKEANELGLQVTGEEILDLSLGDNPHYIAQQYLTDPKTGRIDKQRLSQALSNLENQPPQMQESWKQFEDYLSNERLKEKYFGMIKAGIFVTDLEAKEDFIAHNKTASLSYVPLFVSSISDKEVKVEDGDVKDYYEKHKEDFKREESRSIKFVAFDINPTVGDTQAVQQWMNKQKEAFRNTKNDSGFVVNVGLGKFANTYDPHGSFPAAVEDQIFASDSGTIIGPYLDNGTYKLFKVLGKKKDTISYYKASHILIRPNGNTEADSVEAYKKAEDILKQIKGGADFAKLAAEKSNDPSNASKGGDLGWFKEGAMVKRFNDAVKSHSKGDVFVVRTEFGTHVVKITGNKSNDLVKVAVLEKRVEVGRETRDVAFNKARQFTGLATSGDKFDEATKKMKIDPRVAENIKPGDRNLPVLGNARELIRWAYGQDIKVGSISAPMEVNSKYVVATVTRINTEGYAPLDEIKEDVTVLAKNEKKKQLLAEKLNNAKAKGNTLESIATAVQGSVSNADNVSFANPFLPNLASEPKLVGYAYGMKAGQISPAIEGEAAVFIVKVNSFSDLKVPEKFDTERKNMEMQQKNIQEEAMNALRKGANVKDYRYYYY